MATRPKRMRQQRAFERFTTMNWDEWLLKNHFMKPGDVVSGSLAEILLKTQFDGYLNRKRIEERALLRRLPITSLA